MRRADNSPAAGPVRALWYLGDSRIEIRETPTLAPPPSGVALVRASFSGVSRGTERLVFQGRVPESERERMRAPRQQGGFPGPVKYGYCAVGTVADGPAELIGRAVFCLNPHESLFLAPVGMLAVLPAALPPKRATLAANMETALNALWDSGAGPCDRIVVVGAGVVGLLVAALAARLPGAEVTAVDVDERRRPVAEALGARFATPGEASGEADVVLHASASAAGLNLSLLLAGDEATVVEMSWHGAGETPVALGGAFHARRLKLVSSQVGQVSPARRPRWSNARRLAAALELLANDDRFDLLIDREIAFEDAPRLLPDIFAPGADALGVALAYA